MKILMRRAQTPGRFFGVQFKLWAKLELEGDEQKIINRYDFDQSVLIFVEQQNRFRNAFILGLLSAIPAFFLIAANSNRALGSILAVVTLIATTWFWMDYWRETIYVKDLLHGRYFKCKSIEALVRKEYFLQHVSSYLRQVMESAKQWGGTETQDIPKLDPEMAKQIVIKGL